MMEGVYSERPDMAHFFSPDAKAHSSGRPVKKIIIKRAIGWWKREKAKYRKAREQLGETGQGLTSPADLETINDPADMLQLCGQGNPHLGKTKTLNLDSDGLHEITSHLEGATGDHNMELLDNDSTTFPTSDWPVSETGDLITDEARSSEGEDIPEDTEEEEDDHIVSIHALRPQ
ncbi:BQ5605_C006g03805 [Microbotryum silenes-dioicae]|uniref:BQ5605_C006g03805 protein n=1 Tax=Microbotryum silenes-dioicae TaxID=796604 RepID=A0A2X0M870_9BASI|nr:BQ5605_C006g03805 [Microbotryum silenes-dioicae]